MDSALYSDILYNDDDNNDMSVDDFLNYIKHPINRNKRFELINGRISLMAGNVTINHQINTGYLFNEIGNYLKGKDCKVLYDFNLHLYREDLGECENVYQPDIMINCDSRRIKKRAIVGVPEFVAEVVSESTGKNDYSDKCGNYTRYGVKEYWIVDLLTNQIMVHISGDHVVYKYTFSDEITLRAFPDLSIDFKEILKDKDLDKSELKWLK